MHNTLIRKLESFELLSHEDRSTLTSLTPRIRSAAARVDLISEGDNPENVHLVLDGYACRYKILPGGGRQIMAFLLPGDFCDLNIFILDEMDHSIGTISECKVVSIPRQAIEESMMHSLPITRAFWWCTLVDEAVLREWLANLGGRSPPERIAHLLCELLLRLDVVGHVKDNSFTFPFTQNDIADTMGLSNVHVNRTIRELKALGLITLKARVLTILDFERLKAYCGFQPNYLHLKNSRWGDRRLVPWLSQSQGG